MAAESAEAHFFEVSDTTQTCGYNEDDESKPFSIERGAIEHVAFESAKAQVVPKINVTVSFGASPMTPDKVQACMDGAGVVLPVRSYGLNFIFDGRDYKMAQSSAAEWKAAQR